jgi:hypothetical protein
MWQNDLEFINILNRFQTSSQIIKDINFINKLCYKKPPINNLPHLFYINVITIQHNKKIFENTYGETFAFFAQDVHSKTCPSHFRLSMIPSQTTRSHHELLVNIYMLVELCARKYATLYGLVN